MRNFFSKGSGSSSTPSSRYETGASEYVYPSELYAESKEEKPYGDANRKAIKAFNKHASQGRELMRKVCNLRIASLQEAENLVRYGISPSLDHQAYASSIRNLHGKADKVDAMLNEEARYTAEIDHRQGIDAHTRDSVR